MTTPEPHPFAPRYSDTHLLAVYLNANNELPLPQVGSHVSLQVAQRLETLCDLEGVPLENLEVDSLFQGDPIDGASGTSFFVRLVREGFNDDQLLRLWQRGLFQQPVGGLDSDDAIPPAPTYPFQTERQMHSLAYAVAADADMDRVKTAFEEINDGRELWTSPWAEARTGWQPVDFCHEAARATTAALSEDPEHCSLNPFAILLVGGAATRHPSNPQLDVVTVVVPWRQSPETLDPIRTFSATLDMARDLVGAMGGLANPGIWRSCAEEVLDKKPGAVLRRE